ncbi:hypothetical protein J7M28_00580 [bacterium]|nr:hypothetical protein [bacterium]
MTAHTQRAFTASTAAIVWVGVFVLSLFQVMNYDIWFLLKTGELILNTGSVPRVDPFTFTSLGEPWIMHEWLFCALAELVRRSVGLWALVVIKAIVIASSFTLIFWASVIASKRSRKAQAIIASFLLLAACASRFRFLLRPHIFNFLGIAATILIVELFYSGRRRWLILLPVIAIFWANAQAGAVFAPAYLFLRLAIDYLAWGVLPKYYAAIRLRLDGKMSESKPEAQLPEKTAQSKPITIRRGFHSILLAAFASSAALLLNPYGWRILDFAKSAILEHSSEGGISVMEWTAPDARFKLFWIMFAAVILFLLATIKKWRASDLAVVLAAVVLALGARRYIPIFFFVVAPALGRTLGQLKTFRAGGGFPSRWPGRSALVGLPLMAIALLLFIFFMPSVFVPGIGVNLGAYPEGGVEFVIEHGIDGRMYNSHRFGGYIIFKTYPGRQAFIDGRNVVHKNLWARFARQSFAQITDDYGVDYAIVDIVHDSRRRLFSAEAARVAEAIASASGIEDEQLRWWNRHKGWHLVFFDDNSAVYVDGSDKFSAVRERFEYTYLDPVSTDDRHLAGYLRDDESRRGVLNEAQRAVEQSPSSLSCRLLCASVLLRAGEVERSIEQFSAALVIAPDSAEAKAGLGRAKGAGPRP